MYMSIGVLTRMYASTLARGMGKSIMASLLDTFIIELNLDPSKFTAAQKETYANFKEFLNEVEQGAKRTESAGAKLLNFFTTLKREFLAFAGVSIGGYEIKKMLSDISSMDANIDRVAKSLNIGRKELAQWRAALGEVGGTAEEADSALAAISDTLANWKYGRGISPEVQFLLSNKLPGGRQLVEQGDPNAFLLAVRKAVEQGNMTPREARTMMQGIPGMNDHMMQLLADSDFRKIMERYKDIAPTDADVERAKKYQTAVNELTTAFTKLERLLTIEISPYLSSFGNWLSTLFGSPEEMEKDRTKPDEQKQMDLTNLQSRVVNGFIHWLDQLGYDYFHPKKPGDEGPAAKPTTSPGRSAPGSPSGGWPGGTPGGIFPGVGGQPGQILGGGEEHSLLNIPGFNPASFRGGGYPSYAMLAAAGGGGGRTTTITTTMGNVNIYTQATDAAGIARDFRAKTEQLAFASSANYSLTG